MIVYSMSYLLDACQIGQVQKKEVSSRKYCFFKTVCVEDPRTNDNIKLFSTKMSDMLATDIIFFVGILFYLNY